MLLDKKTEGELRKEKSIAFLKKKEVPYIEHLPMIEDSASVKIKAPEVIAKRMVCTLLTIQYSFDIMQGNGGEEERNFWFAMLEDYEALEELTEKEKHIFSGSASEEELCAMTWKYEAYWVLAWALGFIEELDYPEEVCDCDRAIEIVRDRPELSLLLQAAKPRGIQEILDEADLIYRLDWACVDARIKGNEAPASLNADVVVERHMALNWLIGYDDDWDNVSTDT